MTPVPVLAALVVGAATLTGCAAATHHVDASVKAVKVEQTPGARAANLAQVCAHVESAFRAGTQDDVQQARGLAAELQGMIDVSDPQARRLLRPLHRISEDIGSNRGSTETASQHRAMNRAYERLDLACQPFRQ